MTRREEIRQQCEEKAKQAAQVIGAAAWYEQADKVLTQAEKDEVRAMWDTMSGQSSWIDAFLRWMAL